MSLPRDPEKTRAWQRRSKPIRRQSPKRQAEKPQRDQVTAETLERDGHRCVLDWLGNCNGRLIAHEVVKRSAKAGTHLDTRFTATLCWFHNGWIEGLTSIDQQCLGVMVPGPIFEQLGQAALDEATRIRALRRRALPFWED